VSNPLAKHFDIIQATHALIKKPIIWSWEHVKGHQDDTEHQLTNTKQWNVDMDKAAKVHWTQQHNTTCCYSIRFAGESWHIFVGTKKLGTDQKYQLLDHIAGQVARKYWVGKTSSGTSTLNWWTG